jgi:hypothetical protein
VKITTLWLGVKVLGDGTLSDAAEDNYLAFQEADWMALTDEEGWPRASEPGDVFWMPFPVMGADITLKNGSLVADDGETKITLKNVGISSVLCREDSLVSALVQMLEWPPREREEESLIPELCVGLSGRFGQGRTN